MRTLPVLTLPILAFLAAALPCVSARADDGLEQRLNLKDQAFVPNQLTVPQGQKVKLVITNDDPTPAEFESFELHREKVVAPNGTITVFVGPLDAGTYPFFDDFHRDTTTGTITAK